MPKNKVEDIFPIWTLLFFKLWQSSKWSKLSKIYFLGLIERKEDRLKILSDMIEKVKVVESNPCAYQNELHRYSLPPDIQTTVQFKFKTLDYGIMSHQAALHWLEKLYQEVEQVYTKE